MRLPFLFGRRSFVRKSFALFDSHACSDHTCREPHYAHFAERLRHLRICAARYTEAGPKIADALRIASSFDMIGIDRARFTPTADTHRATSDEGTPNPCASISTAAVQRHEHFVSCVSAADQKQSLRAAGPAFERNKCRQCVVKSIRSAFWYHPATAVPERIQ